MNTHQVADLIKQISKAADKSDLKTSVNVRRGPQSVIITTIVFSQGFEPEEEQ